MKDIPFEKVSLEEVKATVKLELETFQGQRGQGVNWKAYRGKQYQPTPNIKELMPWVQQLREDVRPRNLIIQYPRIAIQLAELWKYPVACEKYLNELMLDDRGTRQGFPPEVAVEITALIAYFNANVLSPRFSVWGDRVGK